MKVAVIGGTGFVGSHVTQALLKAGHEVTLLVRPGSEQKVSDPQRVNTVPGDLGDPDALRSTVGGSDAVIYLVGILREHPRQGITFEAMQYQGVADTVTAATGAGVGRFLLMSANGVKQPGTRYQETKRRAEQHALASGLDVTVLRPSVIFGDPDGRMEFATQLFEQMLRPPLPAVGFFAGASPKRGAVVMSPVHVDDVADAFVQALTDASTSGEILSLGGPEILTWQDMIRRIGTATGRNKWIIPMPIALMRLGALLFDWLPFFPVTRDQLTMLEEGNTADPAVLERLIGRAPRAFSPENLGYLGD